MSILPFVLIARSYYYVFIHRLNINFDIHPRANLEHFTTVCARGAGNLMVNAFLIFATWVGWGKMQPALLGFQSSKVHMPGVSPEVGGADVELKGQSVGGGADVELKG